MLVVFCINLEKLAKFLDRNHEQASKNESSKK